MTSYVVTVKKPNGPTIADALKNKGIHTTGDPTTGHITIHNPTQKELFWIRDNFSKNLIWPGIARMGETYSDMHPT